MALRDTSADAAASISAGSAAFWRGETYKPSAADDWRAGWLAAAAEARRQAQEGAAMLERRQLIADAMRESFAAMRSAADRSKLLPSDRNRLRHAASLIGAVLPYVEGVGAQAPAPRRRRA